MAENNIIIESAEHTRAVKLDMEIKFHAEMAQRSLYEVCRGLKEMKDGELYRELGYQNFEEYCENEVGIKKVQAYKYISVATNLPAEFVHSSEQIGIQKLSLLAKLDEADRQEIVQNVAVDSVTVKQLKAEIEELKAAKALLEETNAGNMQVLNSYQKRNRELQRERNELQEKYDEAEGYKNAYFEENIQLGDENQDLKARIQELEDREPEVIEAEYVDESGEIERLTDENEELKTKNEELETQLQNANVEHLKELSRVRTEARQNAKAVPDNRETYLAHVRYTKEAVGHLKTFMKQHPELAGSSYEFFDNVFLTLANIEVQMNKR